MLGLNKTPGLDSAKIMLGLNKTPGLDSAKILLGLVKTPVRASRDSATLCWGIFISGVGRDGGGGGGGA